MPNYVTNRIKVENIEEIADFMATDETLFDFNKIVPMPESLQIESSSDGDLAKALVTGKLPYHIESREKLEEIIESRKDRTLEEFVALGHKLIMNEKLHGASTWYDWCVDNWGTKWNACDPDVGAEQITFETAWSGVPDLMLKLSEKFPDHEIDYAWADENTGYNVGKFTFKNGQVVDRTDYKDGSKEAFELAFELTEFTKDYYEYNEEMGTYDYKDE